MPLGFLGQIRIIFPLLLLLLPLLTHICGKPNQFSPQNASLPGPKSPMRAEAHIPTDDGYGQMWSAEPRGNSSEWPSSHLAILRPFPFPPLHSYNSPSLGLFGHSIDFTLSFVFKNTSFSFLPHHSPALIDHY